MMCIVKFVPSVKAMGIEHKNVMVMLLSESIRCVAKAVGNMTISDTLQF
jgi:hypothetical protein